MKTYTLFLLSLLAIPAAAQMDMSQMQHHDMSSMQHDAVSDFFMQQGSGTSRNPAAAPMAMMMFDRGGWMLMLHGNAFVNFVHETGPRGDDQLFSTNWAMGSAERKLGPGHLMLRSMLSLEPAVMGARGYPELFQTGETAHGVALVDRQHPHDFFMELAAEYAIDLGNRTIGYLYVAPVGDPALGPVAYPHRTSAAELPQATLAHHLQDSTHITYDVLTAGAKRGAFGLAVSAFHGQEPDENRWNIEHGALDSWSVRGTWDPTPNLTAQLSTGHLHNPERLDAGNVQRTTASVEYVTGGWASSLIFGTNHRSGHNTLSWTAETTLQFNTSNYVTARGEIVDKDEIVPGRTFRIRALTGGYTKDVYQTTHALAGVGGNVTVYSYAGELDALYGSHPLSFYAFVRVRAR